MEGNQTSVIESSNGDIRKLMASAVLESTKKSLKYAVNVFEVGESHEYTFNIWSNINLNRFILQNKDLTDNVITNYKINQPFTSDFSMEEGEKNSSRTWNHGAGRIVSHVETFLTQRLEKSVEGKPYSGNTVKTNSFQAGQIFYSGSLRRKPFSIIWDKYSSRQTKLDFFHNAARTQAFNFQQRPWSPLCNKSAGSECSRKFCKFSMV